MVDWSGSWVITICKRCVWHSRMYEGKDMKKNLKAKASKIKVNSRSRYVEGKGKHAKVVECSKEEKRDCQVI